MEQVKNKENTIYRSFQVIMKGNLKKINNTENGQIRIKHLIKSKRIAKISFKFFLPAKMTFLAVFLNSILNNMKELSPFHLVHVNSRSLLAIFLIIIASTTICEPPCTLEIMHRNVKS